MKRGKIGQSPPIEKKLVMFFSRFYTEELHRITHLYSRNLLLSCFLVIIRPLEIITLSIGMNINELAETDKNMKNF